MKTLFTNIRSITPLVKVGLTANILEWYEFAIYGYLVVVMGQNFLAASHPMMVTVKAYALFSISYIARPLGSVFYGYLGSEIGHGHALKRSLLTMAIPTALIGLLPTYTQVGGLSMFFLLVLRFIQGFAAGGELPMSACYIFEKAPPSVRSFLCSTVATGSSIGLLLSSAMASFLFWRFDNATLLSWAWRIPYLFSIPLSIWIFNLRNEIDQTAIIPQSVSISQLQYRLIDLMRSIKIQVFPLMLLVGFMETCVYILIFWMPTYLSQFLSVPLTVAQSTNTFMLAAYIVFSLFAGYLAGLIGYQRLLILHISAILLSSYPLFWMLQGASYGTLFAVQLVFAWLLSGVVSVMMEVLGGAFDQEARAFGMSVTHTLAAAFFGGTAPLICTYLTYKTGIKMFPAFYMIGFAMIALRVIWRLSRIATYQQVIESN